MLQRPSNCLPPSGLPSASRSTPVLFSAGSLTLKVTGLFKSSSVSLLGNSKVHGCLSRVFWMESFTALQIWINAAARLLFVANYKLLVTTWDFWIERPWKDSPVGIGSTIRSKICFLKTSEKVQGSDFVPRSGIFSSDMARIYKTLIPKSQMIQRLAKYFPNFETCVFFCKILCNLLSCKHALKASALSHTKDLLFDSKLVSYLFPCLCWQMHLETEPTEIEPQLFQAQLVSHFKTSSIRLTSRSSANAEVAGDLRWNRVNPSSLFPLFLLDVFASKWSICPGRPKNQRIRKCSVSGINLRNLPVMKKIPCCNPL